MNITDLQQQLETAENFRLSHQFEQATLLYDEILEDSEETKTHDSVREMRLMVLAGYGRILHVKGQQPEALRKFKQRVEEAHSKIEQVDALVSVGDQQIIMAKYEDAFAVHSQALSVSKKLNYSAGRAFALRGLGQTFSFIGRAEEAISNLKKALSIFQQLENNEEIVRTWNLLGITHAQQGEIDKAIDAFSVGLKNARRVGDMAIASFLSNLGEMYQDLYAFEEAIVYHREGLEIAEKAELRSMELDLCRNLGVDLCYLGQQEEGYTYLKRALSLSRVTGMFDLQLQTLYSIGHYEMQYGKVEQAVKYGRQLLILAEEIKARGHLARARYLLGCCAKQQGKTQEAQQLWQQALFMAHETQQYRLLWQIHAALAEISDSAELARTHNRIAAEVIEQILYPIESQALRSAFMNASSIKVVLDAIS
ncbi:MAG: tetratricopeptide repeat protein [Chloroflexota bacterium]